MSGSSRAEFYEKIYFFEVQNRSRIETRFSFLLSVIVLVVSVGIFGIRLIVGMENYHPGLIYLLFVLIAIASIACALYLFVRGVWGYKYLDLPTAKDLEKYHMNELGKYSELADNAEIAESWAGEAFTEAVLDLFISCSTSYTLNNQAKSDYWYKSVRYTVIAFIFFAISFFPLTQNLQLSIGV